MAVVYVLSGGHQDCRGIGGWQGCRGGMGVLGLAGSVSTQAPERYR